MRHFQLTALVPMWRSGRTSYLTNSLPGAERFPLSFKTRFSGSHFFNHVVLGVQCGGRWGALGLSRRPELMYRPPEHRSLLELLLDFQEAYGRCQHTLSRVKIGHYVSHDPHSVERIHWSHSVLDVERMGFEELRRELERHTRDMRLEIGKAGPPSPSRERKKDMGSPLRNPSSPMKKISQSNRRPSVERRPGSDVNGYQIRV
ncbi:hypothetical protein DNTS_025346 [Danionella cerebrum]|uniref:Uncharacterized protein n=1 Tax=Danionella cerebrum TaxID=2873325 RepID=A0A553NMD4_9TELE|nr:hypothetical protein DNTS_025346 [Danionella translucida]